MNETLDTIKKAVETVHPDVIQLHGSETPEQSAAVKEAFPGIEIWKAVHHDPNSLLLLEQFLNNVDGFVIDAKAKHAWGGSGESFDWSHAGRYIEYGRRMGVPLFIAGGITPDNVQELLEHEPWGIDLSSGLESSGEKDPEKVRQLEKRLCENE
ncbi:phosphoribosylanthranilate isomerase [Sinobaca sp. H24]|uniref:phosphoribosylanthranilate isomerase n=1 Tax=Sinobaca sp. H24 TaxID=2923376 RepID=UPI00207AC8AF|nr:phosphoribosylanthranilate isomerase [Sinobaca sp. H24]